MTIIFNGGKEAARPEGMPIAKTPRVNKYNHQKILNEMLTTIAVCKMDEELKMILRMRIWGIDPLVFSPMSHEEIANVIHTRVDNVKRWEKDAIYNVELYLKNTDVFEAIKKFQLWLLFAPL